jgi:hypothetical protein
MLLRNSRIGGFCALAPGEEIVAGLGAGADALRGVYRIDGMARFC